MICTITHCENYIFYIISCNERWTPVIHIWIKHLLTITSSRHLAQVFNIFAQKSYKLQNCYIFIIDKNFERFLQQELCFKKNYEITLYEKIGKCLEQLKFPKFYFSIFPFENKNSDKFRQKYKII